MDSAMLATTAHVIPLPCQLFDEYPGVPGSLAADMIVEESNPGMGFLCHFGNVLLTPWTQLFNAVIVIELLLHVARTQARGIPAVKPHVKQFRIGDKRVRSRKASMPFPAVPGG